MAEDHRTVVLSILGTLISGFIIFLATLAFNGGAFDMVYFKSYVLPMIISAFALSVFLMLLLVNKKMLARAQVKQNPVA